ncbi:CHAT domain-containing protein [Haladaptatus sp. DYF46]|uniref:CHAT domain-containing protein n=1 Tax=Haladaptatus sp. DYF46 TaxID=2886041 RepID=UPI001E31D088|nr:CHAT domain-containing protein [Haladaptatus sp. DYF46]
MTISFDGRENEVIIQDPIERRTCTLRTFGAVRPKPVANHPFPFPVDDAVRLSTDGFRLSPPVATYVRDTDGEMVRSVEGIANEELPDGPYSIELCAPIKLYVHVEETLSIGATFDEISFEFGSETDIVVGGRSFHRRPSGTVTTTDDPTDVMAAVSTFGSALKTTSPERAFPTLRGHPPAIELGDELHIPDDLRPPETGVIIEVPPTLESVYAVASLAYYLGATVVPGNTPRIVAGGFEHPLDVARGFETEVERVLKRTFLLDCVTRTEGLYPVDLYERRELESMVELDFAALYDASPAERLERYLSIPYTDIEEFVPEWQLTTHVSPAASNVEMLPFLVDDLAVIRTARGTEVSASTIQVPAVDQFVRGSSESSEHSRSTSETAATPRSFVEPERADSLEQVWVGDDAPLGASKATLTAFRNRLERTATEGEIDITVVCNDDEMDEERNLADEVYGSERNLRFDVTVRHDLSVAELRSVLESETHFLHYIGHIDDGGFNCRDGTLDAAELDDIGVEAFLLNACQSYEQGMALIEAGAIGGVVTLSDVINSGAVRVGKTMARLLNRGFPLWAALDIARDRSIIGGQYTVVGDGSINVVQTESITAVLFDIETNGEQFEMTPTTYLSNSDGMGAFVHLQLDEANQSYLASGTLSTLTLDKDEFARFLALEDVPVRLDGQFTWSYAVDAGKFD